MTRKTATLLLVALAGTAAVASSCVGSYSIDAHNTGKLGVLLLKLGDRVPRNPHGYYQGAGIDYPIIAGLHPGTGGHTPVGLRRFKGHEWTLPLKVEVIWQLAELSECDVDRVDASYPGGFEKRGCKWTPLPDQIYRKQLNLFPLRGTAAFWKSGLPNPTTLFSSYSLTVNLIFNEDQLDVEAEAWASNPWN